MFISLQLELSYLETFKNYTINVEGKAGKNECFDIIKSKVAEKPLELSAELNVLRGDITRNLVTKTVLLSIDTVEGDFTANNIKQVLLSK